MSMFLGENLDKKTKRDKNRHKDNSKLKKSSLPNR